MNIENKVFLALHDEYDKDIPNMALVNAKSLGISEAAFYEALQKLKSKKIIMNLYFTKDDKGKINRVYLDSVRFTEYANEYYKNISQANNNFRKDTENSFPDKNRRNYVEGYYENFSQAENNSGKNIENSSPDENKKNKLFISHSSQDIQYIKEIVELLEKIGVREADMFCSSIPNYNVPNEEDIYEYLLKQFKEYNLKVYYILSNNYYNSPTSLNEMGAAWVLKNDYSCILLPGFGFDQIKGVVSRDKAYLKLDADRAEINSRLGQLKDKLINMFKLPPLSPEKWERIRDEFMEEINRNCTKAMP